MSLKNYKLKSKLHISTKKDQHRLPRVNSEHRLNSRETHKSKWKCSEERSWLTKHREPPLLRNNNSYMRWKKTFNHKWSKESNWENKLIKNTLPRDKMLMPLLIRWLMRTMKWWESPKWNKNRANKIWSSQSMKRRHFWKDKRSSRNMKRSLLEDMLNNKDRELKNFNKWKKPLKLKEMPSSRSLLRRKLLEEPKMNILKISEMISKSKSLRKNSVALKEPMLKRNKDKKKNYKLPRTSNLNSRLKD